MRVVLLALLFCFASFFILSQEHYYTWYSNDRSQLPTSLLYENQFIPFNKFFNPIALGFEKDRNFSIGNLNDDCECTETSDIKALYNEVKILTINSKNYQLTHRKIKGELIVSLIPISTNYLTKKSKEIILLREKFSIMSYFFYKVKLNGNHMVLYRYSSNGENKKKKISINLFETKTFKSIYSKQIPYLIEGYKNTRLFEVTLTRKGNVFVIMSPFLFSKKELKIHKPFLLVHEINQTGGIILNELNFNEGIDVFETHLSTNENNTILKIFVRDKNQLESRKYVESIYSYSYKNDQFNKIEAFDIPLETLYEDAVLDGDSDKLSEVVFQDHSPFYIVSDRSFSKKSFNLSDGGEVSVFQSYHDSDYETGMILDDEIRYRRMSSGSYIVKSNPKGEIEWVKFIMSGSSSILATLGRPACSIFPLINKDENIVLYLNDLKEAYNSQGEFIGFDPQRIKSIDKFTGKKRSPVQIIIDSKGDVIKRELLDDYGLNQYILPFYFKVLDNSELFLLRTSLPTRVTVNKEIEFKYLFGIGN